MAKFEECLQRLEKIVQELEKGDVPLETSLTLFEEGMNLSSACRKELEQAEGKVEILLKNQSYPNNSINICDTAPVRATMLQFNILFAAFKLSHSSTNEGYELIDFWMEVYNF